MNNNILQDWQRSLAKELGQNPEWQVFCYDSIASTMDAAKQLSACMSAQRPILVLAREQSAGRGRLGSSWVQPDVGLYATFAVASTVPIHALTGLSLACGCALRKALQTFGCKLTLKWPNDLLTEHGKKVCGILIELSSHTTPPGVLIGIGVNISGVPCGVDNTSSINEQSGEAPSAVAVAAAIAPVLWEYWQKFIQKGFAAFQEEWLSFATGVGQKIKVESGGQIFEGKFSDVSPEGAMVITDSVGNTHRLVSGHVLEMVF